MNEKNKQKAINSVTSTIVEVENLLANLNDLREAIKSENKADFDKAMAELNYETCLVHSQECFKIVTPTTYEIFEN